MDILKCYDLLNISLNANDDEIKKAYKKKSLECHPDKNGGDNEKFIELTNAYEMIIKYKNVSMNFYFFIFLFNSIFKKHITLNITIKLEDIYYNNIKKIVYNRYNENFDIINETLYLDLFDYNEQYIIKNKGDYNIFTKNYNDLIINITLLKHEKIYINDIINKYELCVSYTINLYEYYYGVNTQIKLFNEIIDIDYIPYKYGKVQTINNKGLLFSDEEGNIIRDNLLIMYEVDLNINNLNSDSKIAIKKLFNNKTHHHI